jgi:hypothetical protein
MLITIIPHDDFLHDDRRFRRGRAELVDEHLALEFERRGLVRVILPETPVVPNVLAAGVDAPPSSSPADPVSPKRPVLKLKRPAEETKHFE